MVCRCDLYVSKYYSMNANGGYGMNAPGGPPMNPNMVNFNTSMHSVQVSKLTSSWCLTLIYLLHHGNISNM